MTPQPVTVAPGGVILSVCRLDDDADIARQTALGCLSPAERARAEGFCRDRDRDRFVRARGHMRRELARATGLDPAAIDLEEARGRKPRMRLRSGRACPHFNLSHSGGLAVLAVSWTGPVGIDVELLDRSLDPAQIAASVLAPREREVLSAAGPAGALRLFLAMWTAKEARMKLTGEGMALDPRGIALTLDGEWPTGYLAPAGPAIRLCYPDIHRPDAVCALASRDVAIPQAAP
jgi:4'-phosphopantetheinyl transferase